MKKALTRLGSFLTFLPLLLLVPPLVLALVPEVHSNWDEWFSRHQELFLTEWWFRRAFLFFGGLYGIELNSFAGLTLLIAWTLLLVWLVQLFIGRSPAAWLLRGFCFYLGQALLYCLFFFVAWNSPG